MKRGYWISICLLSAVVALGFLYRPTLHKSMALARAYIYVSKLDHSSQLRRGDIVFHKSQSSQSLAIAAATHSQLTHCGLLDYRHGQWQVLEAVQPVSYTPLWRWIARGAPHSFCLTRLATPLLPQQEELVLQSAKQFLGKNYDLAFDWSDDRIYCSELVYKAYQRGIGKRLGTHTRLGHFDLSHPAVQAKLRARYGSHIPLQEPVISPEAIYQSPSLHSLQSNE